MDSTARAQRAMRRLAKLAISGANITTGLGQTEPKANGT